MSASHFFPPRHAHLQLSAAAQAGGSYNCIIHFHLHTAIVHPAWVNLFGGMAARMQMPAPHTCPARAPLIITYTLVQRMHYRLNHIHIELPLSCELSLSLSGGPLWVHGE